LNKTIMKVPNWGW